MAVIEGFTNVLDRIVAAKANGEAFAIATVIRTVSLNAAKAGAKAIISADGTLSEGWIGGGCARAAVLKAAQDALADGKPRLISVQPPDALLEAGHQAGEVKDGTQYARNMCPSQGTMDIFIEPFQLQAELLVCGATPIAVALADLAHRVGYRVIVIADLAEHRRFTSAHRLLSSFDEFQPTSADRYIAVSTQGRGDEAALAAALSMPAHYVAFVGSHRKASALKEACCFSSKLGFDLASRPPSARLVGATHSRILFYLLTLPPSRPSSRLRSNKRTPRKCARSHRR